MKPPERTNGGAAHRRRNHMSSIQINTRIEVRIVHVGAVRADQLLEEEWIIFEGQVGQVVKIDFYGPARVELKVRVYNSNPVGIRHLKRLVLRTDEFQCLTVEAE
ncbi:MAG: hypothetical protein FGM52_01610 [Mycobacterium sp.]|nr:hypothetical protein [Mycobacterium sp.]